MKAEMTEHLGYEKHDPAGYHSGNSRSGGSRKKLKGDFGETEVETLRDRNGSFEPKIVAKGQTRFAGFADKILSMYARGMTTRGLQSHLEEMYGVEVSATLISNVTDTVMEEVVSWHNRPLSPLYWILYLDGLYVKMRDNGQVQNRAVYVAIALDREGCKEVLGLWVAASKVSRGLEDVDHRRRQAEWHQLFR